MGVSSVVTVIFVEPIQDVCRPHSKDREFHLDLGMLHIGDHGYGLVDRFKIPLVSLPSALSDWSREISEAEYLDLVGPPDLEALRAKHSGLRWMLEWRSEPGREKDYGQVERLIHYISEFDRGNRVVRYRLTVSDMG